jgi:hypothetical protein
VEYAQVDVRDEGAFSGLIDKIYETHGRLDGVIHGAGIIEDKLLRDKSEESFDRVFRTKTESGFILSRKLRPDSLKFLVFFTSVAGRFGNKGQADYAAANEVISKLAVYLDRNWPTRVVAINWGPWAKRGMVSAQLQEQFAQRGIQLVPRSEGPQRLDQEIRFGRKGEAEVIIGGVEGWKEDMEGQGALRVKDFPLIGSTASLKRGSEGMVQLIRTLDPTKDLFIHDHRLDGMPVLPAAFAMELMAEIVAQNWPDLLVAELRDISVLKGIVLKDGPVDVRIVARSLTQSVDRAGIDVQVEITDLSTERRPYYRSVVHLADSLPAPPMYKPIHSSDLQTFPTTIQEAYNRWLFHGPTLQCISAIHGLNEEGIVATVIPSTPEQCLADSTKGQWLIDPVVIDSGFQLAIVWARIYHDFTPLPSRFSVYRRFGPLSGPRFQCYLRSQADPGKLIMHTNLYFVDDGRVLGVFEGAESTCSRVLNRKVGIQTGQ